MNFRQVNLDFHTSEKIPDIGSRFDRQQFQKALIVGNIDSVTLFAKCHHGWSYHPTSANEMHPNLKFDLLGAQIEAAHEIGVKTTVYLSAGLDDKYARKHREYEVCYTNNRDPKAKNYNVPGFRRLCMNTPYLEYFLEQLKEVCMNYNADSLFLDIAGAVPCYCQNCYEDMIADGKNPDDRSAAIEQAIKVHSRYAQRCREIVDSVKPGLPIFHNGGHVHRGYRNLINLNSHLELESLPTGGYGYEHFPLSARYVQPLGTEYLGMTGKFHESWGEFGGFKHPNALRYETCLMISNGAKCSIGDQLHPLGEMDMATYHMIGKAYGEVKQKEAWLDHVTPIADIAVFSYEAYALKEFTFHNDTDIGICRILHEGKYLYDVIDAESDLSGYRVLILPDRVRISADLKKKIDIFLQNGGKILATGKSGLYESLDQFAFDFGVEYVSESSFQPNYLHPMFEISDLYDSAYVLYSPAEITELKDGRMLAKQEQPYFNRTVEHFCSHLHAPDSGLCAGPGMVEGKNGIYIAWQVFSEYADKGSIILKRIIQFALDRLLGDHKTLCTNLGAQGIVTLMQQKEKHRYVNHLLYAVPVKRGKNVEVIEDILPVYQTTVELRVPERINRVYLAPQNISVPYIQKEDRIAFTVDKIECHQMVVMDYDQSG